MFEQKQKVAFIVGQGFDQHGNPLVDKTNRLKAVLTHIAKTYGGYSLVKGEGGWINPAGKLVEEPNISITVYSDLNISAVHQATAEQLAVTFNQESVLLVRDTVPVIVEFVGQRGPQ